MDHIRKWFARPLDEGVTVFGWLAVIVGGGLTLYILIPRIWSEVESNAILNFFGVVFAAGITVWGSAYVAAYRYSAEKKENAYNAASLLSLELSKTIGYYQAALDKIQEDTQNPWQAAIDFFKLKPKPKISALVDAIHIMNLDEEVKLRLLLLDIRILRPLDFNSWDEEIQNKININESVVLDLKEKIEKIIELRDILYVKYPDLNIDFDI
ncbi:hypothetical protein [uncultured Sneathiella sp.]|uniref:hypothetical protein n=1 Tax=uncultured Sneathiella sp. TaxID=879315 RepID=UPI0030EC46C2|tara:strand:+ start:24048 stop:24680 length:633 start_codon:yes stop_codon:yes gene_type:complete